MTATPNSALALNGDGCPENRSACDPCEQQECIVCRLFTPESERDDILCGLTMRAAARAHRIDTIGRVIHAVVPPAVMTTALVFASPPLALAGGAVMLIIQEVGQRLPFWDIDEDDAIYAERIPISLGAAVAIGLVAALETISFPLLCTAMLFAIGLTFWPRASHLYRVRYMPDVIWLRKLCAHPASCSCGSARPQSNSPTSLDVTNGASRATPQGD